MSAESSTSGRFLRRLLQLGLICLCGSILLGCTYLAWWTRNAVHRAEKLAVLKPYIDKQISGITYAPSEAPEWLQNWAGREYFSDVVSIRMTDFETPPEAVEKLVELPSLTDLTLMYVQITDDQLSRLSSKEELRGLIFEGCWSISDEGLKSIQGFKNLRSLRMESCGITDVGLKNLNGLKNLDELTLQEQKLSDLEGIENLTSIRYLLIAKSALTDAGLARIGRLTNLKELHIWDADITGAGLKHFQKLPNLEKLVLNRTKLSDENIKHIPNLSQLKFLWITYTPVGDAGLVHLQGAEHLEELVLDRTQVTDAGLVHLQKLPALTRLHLEHTAVTDAGLRSLHGTQLEYLKLQGSQATPAGFAELVEATPTLRKMAHAGLDPFKPRFPDPFKPHVPE